MANLSRNLWGKFLRVLHLGRGRDTAKEIDDIKKMEVQKGNWVAHAKDQLNILLLPLKWSASHRVKISCHGVVLFVG